MKITVVTGPFLSVPPAPCGAVERVWRDLSGEFAKHGHDVTLISRAHRKLPAGRTDEGLNVHPIKGSRSGRSMPLNLVKDFFYGLRVALAIRKSDVIVTNTFCLPMILGVIRRGAGPVHVHVARMPKRQMNLYVWSGVKQFSALSTAVAVEIEKESPQAKALTTVISNPIRTGVFKPPSTRRDSHRRQIIYTGRIHPEKGLGTLVKAATVLKKEFPDLALRLIGPWEVEDGGGGQSYVDKLKSYAVPGLLEFREAIYDREALRDALYEGDIYCYPSVAERGETFGVAPLEALGTGLPTIVSNLACFRDFIIDGESGLVFDHRCADPVKALADALRRVISDEPFADRLAKSGARTAATFTIEHVAEIYEKKFSELLVRNESMKERSRNTA
ncbi:glycosyltransferase family 4 protein [Candidatus Sumerlaeota bacterium]|nr:glycosyltransferase family 4 protein [Candidatus Sumerlaeota bacterium]